MAFPKKMTTPKTHANRAHPSPPLRSPMEKAALEALISKLDFVIALSLVVGALGGGIAASVGWLRFKRGSDLNDMLTQENLSMKRDIETARLAAAEANQKAEEERLARVKIEEKLADRRFTKEQQETIARKLLRFAGQKLLIVCAVGPEPGQIAQAIVGALEAAKWQLAADIGPVSIRGMIVEADANADAASLAAATELAAALKEENIEVDAPNPSRLVVNLTGAYAHQGPQMPDAKIRLIVGPK